MIASALNCPLCGRFESPSRELIAHVQVVHFATREASEELVERVELGIQGRQSGPVCAPAAGADPTPSASAAKSWPFPVDLSLVLSALPALDASKLTIPTRYLLRRAARALSSCDERTRARFAAELGRAVERALP